MASIALVIALRLALPSILKIYVNRTLSRIPDYHGSVQDIDVALIRGAYTIKGLKLEKKSGKVPVPFLSSRTVDLSMQWKALFEGKFVGEIEAESGKLNFVSGSSKERSQTEIDNEWLKVVKDLFPLRFNRFAVKNFEIAYKDFSSDPRVNITLQNFSLEGKNFSNTRNPESSQTATIEAKANVEGISPLLIKSTVNPSARSPTFSSRASVEKLPLKSLNDLFKAYGNFDVQEGTAAFYLLLSAKNGDLQGQLKPIIKDMKVFSFQEEHDSPLNAFWELTVEALSEIFTNHRKDQVATVVPLKGKLEHVESNDWKAFVGILRNAFFKAVVPGWEVDGKDE